MILTDNAACLTCPRTTNVTNRNTRWLTLLSAFYYTIQHLERKKNVLADTLSRYFKNPARLPLIIRKQDPNKHQHQQQETTTSKHPTITSLPTKPLYLHDITMTSYASAKIFWRPNALVAPWALQAFQRRYSELDPPSLALTPYPRYFITCQTTRFSLRLH